MTPSLSITFRGMKTSPAFDQRIRELMDRMARITAQPLNCRIVIESPHRHSARRRLPVATMYPKRAGPLSATEVIRFSRGMPP